MKIMIKITIVCIGLALSFSVPSAIAMLKSSPIDDQGPTKPPPKTK